MIGLHVTRRRNQRTSSCIHHPAYSGRRQVVHSARTLARDLPDRGGVRGAHSAAVGPRNARRPHRGTLHRRAWRGVVDRYNRPAATSDRRRPCSRRCSGLYLHPTSISVANEPGESTVTLGPGSVWIPAPLLAPAAPADGFAGIAFSSATLLVPDGITVSPGGDTFTVESGVTLQLSLVPAVAAPPSPGTVNDAAAAVAALPADFGVAFAPSGAVVTTMSDSRLHRVRSTRPHSPAVRPAFITIPTFTKSQCGSRP